MAVSHRALSGQQFSGQLQMFMTPDELIEGTHKVDSRHFDYRSDPGREEDPDHVYTPRDQWEAPNSSKYGGNRGVTLRKEKQTDLKKRTDFDRPWDTAPPVELQYRNSEEHPTMMQGHHRLAHAELKGIPYLAVSYRPDHQ